ncbi:sperm associated antigen 8 [Kryptolebias marmoratus]|uniref:Sperm-associated antigen 8 n=1 Tax=Kryptolebias marmoratus TaxID=37003 RepID=A0A3Q3A691_KRYMA|nr:sperm associated antigen 8 [Kryptolebias marmoratus]
MAEQTNTLKSKRGKCLRRNWVEERSVAALDEDDSETRSQKHGHKGIIAMDQEAKMETVTTSKATYVSLKSPGVRLKGVRRELLEKRLAQTISEEVRAQLNPPPPGTEFCSTTQKDFCVQGFVSRRPRATKAHDYKSDQAVTFWSESWRRIQGVTPVRSAGAPFRKSALFSTPITERVDEPDPPSDS